MSKQVKFTAAQVPGIPAKLASSVANAYGVAQAAEKSLGANMAMLFAHGVTAEIALTAPTARTKSEVLTMADDTEVTRGELSITLGMILLSAIYRAPDAFSAFTEAHSMEPTRWAEMAAMTKGERAKEPDAKEFTPLNNRLRSYMPRFAARLNEFGSVDQKIVDAVKQSKAKGKPKGAKPPTADTDASKAITVKYGKDVLGIEKAAFHAKAIIEQFGECEEPSEEFKELSEMAAYVLKDGSFTA